jgi:hypothetical protein
MGAPCRVESMSILLCYLFIGYTIRGPHRSNVFVNIVSGDVFNRILRLATYSVKADP